MFEGAYKRFLYVWLEIFPQLVLCFILSHLSLSLSLSFSLSLSAGIYVTSVQTRRTRQMTIKKILNIIANIHLSEYHLKAYDTNLKSILIKINFI